MSRLLFHLLPVLSLYFFPQEIHGPVLRTHAHNDYLHERPLQDALSHGFVSVEADILLKEDKLYVGHDRVDLENKPLQTLDSLYLRPLFTRFQKNEGRIYPEYSGLFYLWIDIKYDGRAVLDLLQQLIRPYESMIYSAGDPDGKVQLIISGDRPYDLLMSDSFSSFFIDGRPQDLGSGVSSEKMPFISQNLRQVCRLNSEGYLDPLEMEKVRSLVRAGHLEGKKVRLWASPDNIRMWSQLIESDVDLINTDDLNGLVSFLKN